MPLKIIPDGAVSPLHLRISGAGGLPVVISVPHAGRWLPAALADEARAPLPTLARLGDSWADLIAAPLVAAGASLVAARLGRAVADCNRSEADMDPAEVTVPLRPRFGPPGRKARAGLGVVPTRLPGAGSLWRQPVSAAGMETRLDLLHRPYHAALGKAVAAAQRLHGTVLLIDLHSMPAIAATRSDPQPPRIVVGDRFGRAAASDLAVIATGLPAPQLARVAVNQPYAGGHILERHGRPGDGCHALQIEFDRSLYLDAEGLPDADRALALGDWLHRAAELWIDALGARGAQLLAAE